MTRLLPDNDCHDFLCKDFVHSGDCLNTRVGLVGFHASKLPNILVQSMDNFQNIEIPFCQSIG